MMMPGFYASAMLPSTQAGGPAAVEGASARMTRDGGQGGSAHGPRAVAPHGAAQRGGVSILGQAPSLSADMIGVLGSLDLDDVPRFRLDPLTGEPVEIDPLTGQPMSARFTLTPESGLIDQDGAAATAAQEAGTGPNATAGNAGNAGNDERGPDGLTDAERAEVRRLEAIDQQVRQHEAAHKAAGLGVTGPATFTYVTGPDGRQYAVGGEVTINANVGSGSPEQAIRDLEMVKAAALAPADPSPQDRAVAAAAEAALARAEAAARDEEEREQAEQRGRNDASGGAGGGNPFAQAAAAYGAVGALAPGGGGDGGAAPANDAGALFSLVA